MRATYTSLSLHSKVALENTSTKMIPANARRVYARIRNNGSVSMWLGLGEAAVVGQGFLLEPGEWYEININTNPFVGSLYGIFDTALASVDVPVEEAIN